MSDSTVAIISPGGDQDHPWVREFAGAMAIRSRSCLHLIDAGDGAVAARSGSDSQRQRSPEANAARIEQSRRTLQHHRTARRLQIYTNDVLPKDCVEFVLTDIFLAVLAEHASSSNLDGFEWEADALNAALVRERELLERAKLIFVPTRWLAQWSDIHLPSSINDKIRVVGWGPGISLLDVGAQKLACDHVESRALTALFVGNDAGRKGLDDVLYAVEQVNRSGIHLRLLTVGRQAVAEGPHVTALGYLDLRTPEGRESIRDAYRRSDIFVLPSRFDPVGCAYIEALQAALPILALRRHAAPELVGSEAGWLIDKEDELAQAFTLASDSVERLRRSKVAFERAQYWSWRGVAERIGTAIESAS